MYVVHLTNFGYSVHQGNDLAAAKAAAEKTGFECTILQDNAVVWTWSPISGWRSPIPA